MEIFIFACGVFQPELDKILPGLAKEFPGHTITAVYLEMALHNYIEKLKQSVTDALRQHTGKQKVIVLYGSMCHPDMKELCREFGATLPLENNCIDMFVSEEEQRQIAKGEEIFYLTGGWFANWRDSLLVSGWDTYDARMNFGRYDSFILLDTDLVEFSDEAILDFFEYTTVPIDTHPIDLNRFIELVRQSIRRAVS